MELYSFIDELGFWRSTVTEYAVETMPQAVRDTLIHSVPPTTSAGHLKAWAWNAETEAWEAKDSYKGHFWYNPERTKERMLCKSHADVPPPGWFLLPAGEEITPAVIEIKEERWAQVKKARETHEFQTFTWDGSVFDSDQISQSRIQGSAQMAMLAKQVGDTTFSVDWTLADNSVRTLTADEMLAVGMAMGQHIKATHTKGRQLRTAIANAATAAEVEAVVW